ncbi:MAG: helix-turn-helix transcriptional regulator, partial [Anaerolineae bacterium]
GLQLAGLSIRDRANPSSFIATLSGSHRFILSYLTEEVLNRQPEEVQRFLLQTSILDELNGDLCNAVTGRSDGRTLLERLFSANLFLIPLDDEGQWYRYHHLFSDLLRDLQNALQKEDTAELHQRAAHWYAQVGEWTYSNVMPWT